MHNNLSHYTHMKPHERLIEARKAAGFEYAQDAAAALGVKYPTYAAHENGSRQFTQSAALYAKRFKTTIDWLLLGKPDGNQVVTKLVFPDRPEGQPEGTPGRFQQVRIVGSVKASSWQDVTEQLMTDEPQYVPSASGYPAEWQYAYTVDGPSVNKTARDGDILVCVDLIKSGADVAENDLVIVERTRFHGAMLERTAKRVRKAIAGYELWPDSDDPEFQDALPLSEAKDEEGDEEVRVSAKVIWILRKP